MRQCVSDPVTISVYFDRPLKAKTEQRAKTLRKSVSKHLRDLAIADLADLGAPPGSDPGGAEFMSDEQGLGRTTTSNPASSAAQQGHPEKSNQT